MAIRRGWVIGAVMVAGLSIFLALGGWRLLDLYAGPWESYQGPARAFLTAVAGRDSLALVKLGAAPVAIRRALSATRPDRLPKGRLFVAASGQVGDTTRLTYMSECPVVLGFVESWFRYRVVDVDFLCSDP
jgi:hypothetical protein